MLTSSCKHLLTGEELTVDDIQSLLTLASNLKRARKQTPKPLAGKQLAMLFDKPSLRTRFSFAVAMDELGGNVIESTNDSRKKEDPEDVAGVLSCYCDGVVIRTFSDKELINLAKASKIPIINALSNEHHPCQILADLLTLKEHFNSCEGVKLSYIGDGNNILHSLLLITPLLGIDLHYCCPKGCEPKDTIVQKAKQRAALSRGSITSHLLPQEAVKNAQAVYTDVWTSMGFENDSKEELFNGFQVNEKLMALALPEAIFMHCMPIVKGKEVSATLASSSQSIIFEQCENRLHVQKALLIHFLGEAI